MKKFLRRVVRAFRPAPPANAAFLRQMRAGTMPAGVAREKAEREAREKEEKCSTD